MHQEIDERATGLRVRSERGFRGRLGFSPLTNHLSLLTRSPDERGAHPYRFETKDATVVVMVASS